MNASKQIKELPYVVLAIVMVALVAAMLGIILNEIQTSEETTVDVTNETVTFTALDTNYYLVNNATSISYWVTLVNTTASVTNASNGAVADRSGNWSLDLSLGRIQAITGGVINAGEDWNVTYQYTYGTEARNLFGEGITAVGEVTSWLDLIALVLVAGILLYLVVRAIKPPNMKY